MKKITSLSLGISFLIMSYTGIFLFLAPHGKVAYWSDWHLWGLTKNQYGDLHTTSMVSFLILGGLHIYYNWKPITSYMKNASKKITFTKKEFLIALFINVIFVVGTLYLVAPFGSFLKMESTIKNSWTKKYGEPPYGHAEETKLNVFCKKLDIDLDKAKDTLNKNGFKFQENESLKTIAKNNNISPNKIFDLIKPFSKNRSSSNDSSINKLGRKTLADLADMKKIDLQKAINILKQNGLNDVASDSRIKNIADELNMMPKEVYELINK